MRSTRSAQALSALLFLVGVLYSNAQSAGAAEGTEAPVPPSAAAPAPEADKGTIEDFIYDVRSDLSLKCKLDHAADTRVVWKKNGTEVTGGGYYLVEEEGTLLKIKKTNNDDYGEYACSVGGATHTWRVRGRTHAKLPANSNVVEGQKLKLTCGLTGKPYPDVHWLFFNETAEALNGTRVEEALGARVSTNVSADGVHGAELVLEDARRTDAGRLMCVAGGANATTTLRVKDMYAALWPFLGICAEVFVLCAIILVYEKRRTKPELDDSDTDNHDQKKS